MVITRQDNILVDQHGQACLADFGLASHVDGEMLRWTMMESTGLAGGTAHWQAPELLDPEDEDSRPTKDSDIYALGCVFYEVCLYALMRSIWLVLTDE